MAKPSSLIPTIAMHRLASIAAAEGGGAPWMENAMVFDDRDASAYHVVWQEKTEDPYGVLVKTIPYTLEGDPSAYVEAVDLAVKLAKEN